MCGYEFICTLCATFGPAIFLHSCYTSGPSSLLFQCVFYNVNYLCSFPGFWAGILSCNFRPNIFLSICSLSGSQFVCQLFIETPCLTAIGRCWQDTLVHYLFLEWKGELSVLEYFLVFCFCFCKTAPRCSDLGIDYFFCSVFEVCTSKQNRTEHKQACFLHFLYVKTESYRTQTGMFSTLSIRQNRIVPNTNRHVFYTFYTSKQNRTEHKQACFLHFLYVKTESYRTQTGMFSTHKTHILQSKSECYSHATKSDWGVKTYFSAQPTLFRFDRYSSSCIPLRSVWIQFSNL